MIHIKLLVGKRATNENALDVVLKMFYFVKNTAKIDEKTKRKEIMKNRVKQQRKGHQKKLAMIHMKETLEG